MATWHFPPQSGGALCFSPFSEQVHSRNLAINLLTDYVVQCMKSRWAPKHVQLCIPYIIIFNEWPWNKKLIGMGQKLQLYFKIDIFSILKQFPLWNVFSSFNIMNYPHKGVPVRLLWGHFSTAANQRTIVKKWEMHEGFHCERENSGVVISEAATGIMSDNFPL